MGVDSGRSSRAGCRVVFSTIPAHVTQLALFGIGGAALGLLLLGIHNAWDAVTYIVGGGSRGGAPKTE